MVKSILFVAYLVACLILVFGGLIWTDYATKSFWWTFWEITPWVGGLGFIGGIYWYFSSKQNN